MGDFVTAFARGQTAARPGADAAVQPCVQRATEHARTQSGAPASPHMNDRTGAGKVAASLVIDEIC